jgi:hypothetical protein
MKVTDEELIRWMDGHNIGTHRPPPSKMWGDIWTIVAGFMLGVAIGAVAAGFWLVSVLSRY